MLNVSLLPHTLDVMSVARTHFREALSLLSSLIEDDPFITSIDSASDAISACLRSGGKILCCGNGGSMSDAMHFAEELSGRFREDRPAYAAIAISSPAHITCVANDYGYDKVFSRAVEALGRPGDILLAITTSGNSPNCFIIADSINANMNSLIKFYSLEGGDLDHIIPNEIQGTLSSFSMQNEKLRFSVSGFTTPTRYVDLNLETQEFNIVWEDKVSNFNPNDYQETFAYYDSKDGT